MEKDVQTRNTKQRMVVRDAVMARYDHPTADDIYLDVRAVNSSISRGTVYRNLSILCEAKEIGHVRVPEGADRFDRTVEKHYHILCKKCRKVVDAPFPYDDVQDLLCEELSGFTIERHRTVFEGECAECRKKESAQAGIQ